MKQTNLSFCLMAACLVCGLAFTACSSDDDDDWDGTAIQISYIYGYWADDANDDNWLYNRDYTGLYWDASESSEEEAATGAGKFRWEYDTVTGLMRYHWMTSEDDYANPETTDPSKILSLTSTRMIYRDVFGDEHSFTKYTK